MSIASAINRAGKTCTWRKMSGALGTYDTVTGNVTAPTYTDKKIKAVLDGFGSVESVLKALLFEKETLVIAGHLRVFTVAELQQGDILFIDDDAYTVSSVKSIWKKEKVVCRMAVAQL